MDKILLALAVLGAILATGCGQITTRPAMGLDWHNQNQAENARLAAQGFSVYSPAP